MEEIKEYKSEDEKYISGSKKSINNFIHKHDYKRAFWLLILVLERLNDNQKKEFIDHYSKNFTLNYAGER
jgi:hypothetical protein